MTAVAHGNFRGKHLVVLGCGYVGTAVAQEALARGVRVSALTRNESKAVVLRETGIDVVVADLADTTWHMRIPSGADLVLDCVSSGGGGIEGYRRSYVEGMKSMLTWAANGAQTGTIVYTSSTSVYPQSGGAIVDERTATGGDERAAALLEAEGHLRRNTGVCRRWFVLRLAGIYGPGRHHLLSQVKAGEIAGRAGHRLNLAHRDDIAAAVWACFSAPETIANEVFNVVDDQAAPKREVVDWVAGRIGAPAPRFSEAPATGRRTITPDRTIANAKLKSMLGWTPRFPTYREGYETLLSR